MNHNNLQNRLIFFVITFQPIVIMITDLNSRKLRIYSSEKSTNFCNCTIV